jgi:hypothetical protein
MPTPAVLSARATFDPAALHGALQARITARGISWRQMSREAGIKTVGIGTELAHGRHPTAGQLARLLLWLGDTDLGPYLTRVDAAAG